MEGPRSGVRYDAGPASPKSTERPHEPAEPPVTVSLELHNQTHR